jgi:hypothetical protein
MTINFVEAVDELRAALKRALDDLGGSHSGHWDPTQQRGAGCPVCIKEWDIKVELRKVLAKYPPTSHCAIHDVDELITPETFRVCFECSHVWTIEDLLKDYNEGMRRAFADTAVVTIPEVEEKLRLLPIEDPYKVYFCPLCLHDF